LTATSQLNPTESKLRTQPPDPGSRLRTLHAIFFVLVLGGILTAGLWPFHSPKNDVSWLPSGSGLSFGAYGTILSSGMFDATNVADHTPCSLEIWVESYLPWDTSTLLAFYDPETHKQFSLHVWYRSRLLQRKQSSGVPASRSPGGEHPPTRRAENSPAPSFREESRVQKRTAIPRRRRGSHLRPVPRPGHEALSGQRSPPL
jgi:hypothetical protein